jgi:hypothetical protein
MSKEMALSWTSDTVSGSSSTRKKRTDITQLSPPNLNLGVDITQLSPPNLNLEVSSCSNLYFDNHCM